MELGLIDGDLGEGFVAAVCGEDVLLLRIVERLGGEQQDLAARWYEREGSDPDRLRDALVAVVASWERDGALFAALADAAADDLEVERAHRSIMDSVIDATAEHIEREIEAGNMLAVDPLETARALTLMTDGYLRTVVGRERIVATDVVVDTLVTIFTRTLYGER